MERVGASRAGRRFRLKDRTARHHEAVDAAIEGAFLLAGVEGYRSYVTATLLARRNIENELTRSEAAKIYSAWPHRRIAHLVKRDLADLTTEMPADFPNLELIPLSDGAILGRLYVLEGSALGARIIARRVAHIGMGAEFGARHLARQAADSAAWPAFLEILENFPLTDEEDDACMRAAVATFDCFKSHFQRGG